MTGKKNQIQKILKNPNSFVSQESSFYLLDSKPLSTDPVTIISDLRDP